MTSVETKYETVIGLEVHIQLNTSSKAFSSDINEFTLLPNQNISWVTLALPGTLPMINKNHVEKAVKLSLALKSKINERTTFDRKNYFYPDLPKGYQITQDKAPIGIGGQFDFLSEGVETTIRIHHLHMEEDAGKSSHDRTDGFSLLDYNRAGTPLIELVTEPDFRTAQQVFDFLTEMQQLVQYLDISDGNMEEGSIRCDCNVSVRKKGQLLLGERCEIKNVNSRRYAKQAINYEVSRQIKIIESGGKIEKTTMLFDTVKGETRPMRKKETENDYRYFPEPDLNPILINKQTIANIRQNISWLPQSIKNHMKSLEGPEEDIEKLTENKENAIFFIEVLEKTNADVRELSGLFINKLLPYADSSGIKLNEVLPLQTISDFIELISKGSVSKSNAYALLLPRLIESQNKNVHENATELNLIMENNQDFLDPIIDEVLLLNAEKLKEYKAGKKGLVGFFMGQVKMKAGNNINPIVLKEKVELKLNEV